MEKYTNEEDKRQTVSLIVRTLLGIAVTFVLLCRYSGECISLHICVCFSRRFSEENFSDNNSHIVG